MPCSLANFTKIWTLYIKPAIWYFVILCGVYFVVCSDTEVNMDVDQSPLSQLLAEALEPMNDEETLRMDEEPPNNVEEPLNNVAFNIYRPNLYLFSSAQVCVMLFTYILCGHWGTQYEVVYIETSNIDECYIIVKLGV